MVGSSLLSTYRKSSFERLLKDFRQFDRDLVPTAVPVVVESFIISIEEVLFPLLKIVLRQVFQVLGLILLTVAEIPRQRLYCYPEFVVVSFHDLVKFRDVLIYLLVLYYDGGIQGVIFVGENVVVFATSSML